MLETQLNDVSNFLHLVQIILGCSAKGGKITAEGKFSTMESVNQRAF